MPCPYAFIDSLLSSSVYLFIPEGLLSEVEIIKLKNMVISTKIGALEMIL
jgi:hypothetical protein